MLRLLDRATLRWVLFRFGEDDEVGMSAFSGEPAATPASGIRTSVRYLLLGIGFGLLFPLLSTPIAVLSRGMDLDFGSLWAIQKGEPLIWVIDTAPIFLGFFAWVAGVRQERLEAFNQEATSDLEHLLRISRDILCVCNTEGEVLRSNLILEKLTGREKDDIIGSPISDLVHPEDREGMAANLIQAAESHKETYFETRIQAHGNRTLLVEWSVSMPLDDKLLVIGRNVTSKRRDEEQLTLYAESLERSLRELDRFAYVVSHDLKAPLRGIYTLADFIAEDLEESPGSVRRHLVLLKKRVERMQNLINGVLEYSRAAKGLDERVEIDLQTLLQETAESVDFPEGYEIRLPENLPEVCFNRTKLFQVLQNLISNAVRFNGQADGWVMIGCREIPEGWEFSVTDNGPGIPAQYHEQVFAMFRTLKSRDEVESTGMGLSIVKKILEESGGSIWIDGQYTGGTRIVFTIVR